MITILLIAVAAGCASALMFASIISGVLISLLLFYLAPLPLMVAGLAWGPLSATIGGIAAACRPRRDLRLSLWHRLCHHDCAARLVARAPRFAGAARRWRCRCGRRHPARRTGTGMVPDRPHPAVDRRFCHPDHDRDPVHAWHRRRHDQQGHTQDPAMVSRIARRRGPVRRNRAGARRTGDRRAGSGRHLHHDDADAQPLARRKDRRDVGATAPPLARHERCGPAADDARGVVAGTRLLLHHRTARDAGADRRGDADHGIRAHRLCSPAHIDDVAQTSRIVAGLHLRGRGDFQLAGSRHGGSRACRCGFRPSPALSAGKTAAARPHPESALQFQPVDHHLKGARTWKSFCWNASPSSARWARSSASRMDLRAIFS